MTDSPLPGFPLRLDWRPSRGLLVAMGLLIAGALASVWLSGLPSALRWTLLGLALLGGAWQLWREGRAPSGTLLWAAPGEPAHWLESGVECPVEVLEIRLRGPLAGIRLREAGGRRRWRLWGPDTLSDSDRRALRLVRSTHERATLLPLVAG